MRQKTESSDTDSQDAPDDWWYDHDDQYGMSLAITFVTNFFCRRPHTPNFIILTAAKHPRNGQTYDGDDSIRTKSIQ